MFRPQIFLKDGQCMLIQRFSLRVLASGRVEDCKVIESFCERGIFWSQRSLPNCHGIIVKSFGLCEIPSFPVNLAEIIVILSDIRTIRSVNFQINGQRALKKYFSLRKFASYYG